MDNTTAKVSCFARAYHFENNKTHIFADSMAARLLGISYYLEKDEWKKLIRLVACIMPAGSAICFDFPSTDESKETKVNKTLASGAGEQMKALYSIAEIKELLSEYGFAVAEHLGADRRREKIPKEN